MSDQTYKIMQTHYLELSDTHWQIIEQILNDAQKRKYNLRDIVNRFLEILRTGTQWRKVKHSNLPWQVVYYYFRKWKRCGTLERLNSELHKQERKRQGKHEMPNLLCIDSQSIKLDSFVKSRAWT